MMETNSIDLNIGMAFERGTDIGFQMDEIKQNTTEDLLILRSSIYSYLKLKKLKKRNSKYMDLYIRINKELSLRNSANTNNENSTNKKEEQSNDAKSTKTNSFSAKSIFEFFETQKNKEKKDDLLCKKLKNSSQIDIPNFLNDKTNEQIKKKKEVIKEKEENIFKAIQIKENLNSGIDNNYSGKYIFYYIYKLLKKIIKILII